MKNIPLIVFILSSVISVSALSQNNLPEEEAMKFKDFADSVQKLYNTKVFYSQKWGEEIIIQPNFNGKTLQTVLDNSFSNKIRYLITEDGNVVITKSHKISSNYFLGYTANRSDNLSENNLITESFSTNEIEKINPEFRKFTIGTSTGNQQLGLKQVSGYLKNKHNGEPILGAVVFNVTTQKGGVSDKNGFYSLELEKGNHILEYRVLGMRSTRRQINLIGDGTLDVEMEEQIATLDEVVVSADRESAVNSLKMGMVKLDAKILKQIPMGLGEADVIKSALLLPGVQTVGEASSGFNVRGGSTDQNLILLDKAPIMNTSHFFGFFSAFNSDLIEDVSLYKSGMPAKLGGRVSSIMDIEMRKGNNEKFKLNGGISPVSARLSLEGPIIKKKASFVVGVRSTYSDYILKFLSDYRLKNSKAGFYDVQSSINYQINNKNSVRFSAYISSDLFDYYKETSYTYNNLAGTLTWRHIINKKLISEFSLVGSSYGYSIDSKSDETQSSNLIYQLDHKIGRLDFNYFPHPNHAVDFGVEQTFYNLEPGDRKPLGAESSILPNKLQNERARQTSIYMSDRFELTPLLNVTIGTRVNVFRAVGPHTYNKYKEGVPLSEESILEPIEIKSGEPVKTFTNPELRFTGRYKTSTNSSIKGGFTRMFQYIHMISNTTSISPTDIWKLSDLYIKPQISNQFSVGYYQNILKSKAEASVEIYYKKMNNIIDYKEGAELIMNHALETQLLNGVGKAYGVEFMIKKSQGKLNGWISYAYSRSFHKINGDYEEEKVNNGEYFPSNYDKPHDFKLVSNYKFTRRINVTTNFIYNTGRPITYPVAYFQYANSNRVYYSKRNEFRIPDYLRLDVAATMSGNLKKNKLNHSSFTLAVYNVLGRRNPYSIFFKTENGEINAYKMSIFGQPIVTLTYNFKFHGNAEDD